MIDQAVEATARRSRSRAASTRASASGSTRWSPRPAARSSTRRATSRSMRTAKQAAEIVHGLATTRPAPPGLATNAEDDARLGLRVRPLGVRDQLPVRLPEREGRGQGASRRRWAGRATPPSRPASRAASPLGGINLGVGRVHQEPGPGLRGRDLPAQPKNQIVAAEKGGLPPTTESALREPRDQEGLPVRRRCCRKASPTRRRDRSTRPTATSRSRSRRRFHPREQDQAGRAREQAEGPPREGGRGEDLLMAERRPASPTRARSERRLAWMLCAPAVIVMLLVTGYPIVYAFSSRCSSTTCASRTRRSSSGSRTTSTC